MVDSVRMPGLYWALQRERSTNPEDLANRVNGAKPVTVWGWELDLFSGTVPTAAQASMFTDRYDRKYTVTADNNVRPAAPGETILNGLRRHPI